jgi:hypothetical protein
MAWCLIKHRENFFTYLCTAVVIRILEGNILHSSFNSWIIFLVDTGRIISLVQNRLKQEGNCVWKGREGWGSR